MTSFLPPVPKQGDYGATKLHFKNLADRYGNPIIILDLTKVLFILSRDCTFLYASVDNPLENYLEIVNITTQTREKKPRETLLHAEYVNAIGCINAECSEENRLKLLQWDLKQHSRRLSLFSSPILISTSSYYFILYNLKPNNNNFLQRSFHRVVKAKGFD